MHTEKLSAIVALFVIALIISVFVFQASPTPEMSSPIGKINPVPENLNIKWDPKGLSKENLRNVALASDNFALALLSQMFNASNNTIISPLSIWLALSMLYEGARGSTAEEMREVLNLPENRSVLEENIRWFLENFGNQSGNYTLKIADALWAQENYPIRQKYVQILRDYYRTYFQTLNFAQNPEGSRKIINLWVENHTNGKIKNLLPKRSITRVTVAVLTNAIYFYGSWLYPFNESLTDKEFFYTSNGRVLVDMMHLSGDLWYTEDKDAQVIQLPYKNCNLSMLIVLPKGKTLNLTLDRLMSWRKSIGMADVNLTLPKFNLTTKYRLKQPLENMGMKKVFTPSADLTGISPSGGIWADEVYHKAYISVDEKGTEAAGATAIPIVKGILPHVEFRVDHPFLFIIQDRNTGAIFFMGWVVNPLE